MNQAVQTPFWAVLPFALYLFLIASLPLVLGRLWEHNRNKLTLALLVSAPVAVYLLGMRPGGAWLLVESVRDYAAFMALLGALFVVSGGIYIRGSFAGRPAVNTAFLATGAVLASLVGTTGASALLIRPVVRANEGRTHVRHVVIFFIFIVANAGGVLTPLGDPPLFLGFLRGVPFAWTLRLWPQYLLVNGLLLVVFALIDRRLWRRERRGAVAREPERFRIEGRRNLVWLAGVIGTVAAVGSLGDRLGSPNVRAAVQIVAMLGFALASLRTTPARIREDNRFSWGPILEVAVVFVGVFVTMVPALCFLEERGAGLGVTRPWQFFWASGALSSVLDNAPTYLTFASLASGVADAGTGTLHGDLGLLAAHASGHLLLAAVSCGSVFMGAITYIGNGPNFMVKAIAEQHHVRMPGFFGYVAWSLAILVPIFALVSVLFF